MCRLIASVLVLLWAFTGLAVALVWLTLDFSWGFQAYLAGMSVLIVWSWFPNELPKEHKASAAAIARILGTSLLGGLVFGVLCSFRLGIDLAVFCGVLAGTSLLVTGGFVEVFIYIVHAADSHDESKQDRVV